ncbi:D-alanyl-D-alanine carboxypeptidase family protein [Streptomyces sp. NBC_01268]|uniref:D-alanyl-D-alanine carboxypeptidase family protein n=1 Tax=Streptomyces sp. NBC_01268 TaxID=2903806 RepID=UPI002E37DE38|nr:D-alanyl-D-alanine carboxypeptidase [Streptomyces sp. NBC_01268]
MAGESPDKAEQRESVAGGDGKDPRLSVLQDRVDEPTAVFKALAPRTAPEDAQGAPEGGASGEDARESAEDAVEGTDAGAEDAAPEGDRLRAAVAAWVATEDDEEGAEAPEAPEGAGTAAGASDAVVSEAVGDTDEPEAVEAADADADGPDAEAGAEAEAEAEERTAAAEAAEPEPETADAADAADDAEQRSEAAPEPEVEPEAEPEADKASAADKASEVDKASEAAVASPARTTSWAKGDGASEEPKAAAAAGGESWFARKATAPEAAPAPEPTAAPEPEAEAKPAAAPTPAPVDQPTAVFKAPKLPAEPKAPVVDQPTTALKLPESMFRPLKGDITQEQPKPPAAAAPAAEAEVPAPAPVPPALAEAERTRQQPLPPRPPLEILAELTNTPPPPETPLRTGVRRVKIWTPLVLLLLVVFAVVQIVRPLPDPALTLSAAPTYTFDGGALQLPWPSEGQGAAEVEGVGSLGTYGPQKPAPIASVAKTMTAYVILRDHPVKGKEKGPKIEVDAIAGEQAKAKDESTAPIKEGQTYTEKELLELLMIPSGNNVARLLARWDAGSEAAFVEKMNAAAKELGMTESTYTDPSGLQSSTVSTPLDQLKLAKAVMQYDVFREIVDMPNVTVDGIPGRIENNNKILLEPGVSGIKTGSSTPAGGNLLWAAYTVVDGKKQRVLGIVMGAKDADQLWQKLDLAIANSLKVIQQAQKDVTSAAVVKKGQVVGYVDDGLGGRTPVVATKELRAVGWPGLKVDLELTNGGKALPHSGKAGDVVGQVSIGTGNGKVSAPVALQGDLVEPGLGKKLTRVG